MLTHENDTAWVERKKSEDKRCKMYDGRGKMIERKIQELKNKLKKSR